MKEINIFDNLRDIKQDFYVYEFYLYASFF